MKNNTIKLKDGEAAIVIDKNCNSVALFEDTKNDKQPIGSNTYLLISLILAIRNYKLIRKVLDYAEKVLKGKDFREVLGLVEKRRKEK